MTSNISQPRRLYQHLILMLMALTLGACALEQIDQTKDWSAQQLYDSAKDLLEYGDYEKAIDYYGKLDTRYPIGILAQQAKLDTAYAYYKFNKSSQAIGAIDQFIKLHPRHPNVDYAYYLKGLVNDEGSRHFIDKLFNTDRSLRDSSSALTAFRAFAELVGRFPSSRYTEDARQRMFSLRNTLAQHELSVADYYLERGIFVAAVNRAQFVIENYQHTVAIPDALIVLAKAYKALELEDQYLDTVRIIKLNYPHRVAELAGTSKNSNGMWIWGKG